MKRPRLSYASVTATLALFVALGGSAYAVTQINGSSIQKRSIPGNRLELRAVGAREINTKGLVVRRALSANKVRGLFFTHSHVMRKHRAGAAGIADASPAPATISLLALGDTATLITDGSYQITASCQPDSGGDPKLTIQVSTTLSDTLVLDQWGLTHAQDNGAQVIQPGQPATVFGYDDNQGYTQGQPLARPIGELVAYAPGGPELTTGQIYAGFFFQNAACFATTYAVGQ